MMKLQKVIIITSEYGTTQREMNSKWNERIVRIILYFIATKLYNM